MNRIQRTVLAPTIKAVRLHNKHLWWELKWQVWDGGLRDYYPRQGEYELPARQALACLDDAAFSLLEDEWKRENPSEELSRERVLGYFAAVVVEEIVRRASIAAYRTNEW